MNTTAIKEKEAGNLFQRSRGCLEVSFIEVEGETTLSNLHQSGSLKALIPNSFTSGKEAILINTGGGIAGGDQFSLSIYGGNNTETWITSQASEKVYKSTGDTSRVEINLTLGENSSLYWCPQEMILFDNSRLCRTMNVNLENTSNLLMVENIIFGRIASGEFITNCYFSDQWRVRRNQKLVLAENFLFTGSDSLNGKANLGNNNCVCTIIYVSSHSEGYLAQVREIMTERRIVGGASSWNNCLVVRLVAEDPCIIKHFTTILLKLFSNQKQSIPRVWLI